MKVNFRSLILVIVIIVATILTVSMFTKTNNNEDVFEYSDLIQLFEDDMVYEFTVDGNNVMYIKALQIDKELDDGTVVFKKLENGNYDLKSYEFTITREFQYDRIDKYISDGELKNLANYNFEAPGKTPWYVLYLPYIIMGGLLIISAVFMFKFASTGGAGGRMGSFAKSHAKVNFDDKDAVKFADVAGADEEKAELEEVVEFLKNPAKFVKLGARIPRGVLLVGPPGTGKTLLAKAVAGEAGVPFFSISGSDFVEMYVGVGASRVRDLFDNARKTNASIIFIDEIDAVGRHRGAGLGGGHDEREQTLNQLLVEMDGFGTNSGVIVMAATNRPDILDPALLRPGRFDRQITVNYPDMNGREAILKVHCRNKPLEETVDLRKIAQTTIGFTGAELANLMNEAALHAAKANKALIGQDDIEASYMKMLLGPQKKTKVRSDEDNKLCAYHEAGHALCAHFSKHADPVKHITIVPAGSSGGVTLVVPTKDKMGMSKNGMLDDIVVSLGGRVAEAVVLDDISTGASNDIRQATKTAKSMVMKYGMSEKLGTVLYGSDHSDDEVFLGRDFSSNKDYSEKTAAEIDDEVRNIISNAYKKCEEILTTHIDKLHFVAQFLLKNEVMDEDQFNAAMSMDNPTIEEIENIAIERKRKSEEENKVAHENNAKRDEELKKERERLAAEALGKVVEEAKQSEEKIDSIDSSKQEEGNASNEEKSSDEEKSSSKEKTSSEDSSNDETKQ